MEKEIIIKGDLEEHAEKVKRAIEVLDLIALYKHNPELIKKITLSCEIIRRYTISINEMDDKIIINTKRQLWRNGLGESG